DLARIEREGFVEFSAKQLKEKGSREPRLLAKHDFSASRPEIFQEHNLSIFPIRRDGYVVGNFDVYEPFPETVTPLKTLPVPQGVESLDFDNLSSETLVLNAAVIAGVLQDFLGVDKLHATVAGRMSTGTVSMRLRGEELVVDRAQMEIDGGFEAPSAWCSSSARITSRPISTFASLYLPFRRFSQQLGRKLCRYTWSIPTASSTCIAIVSAMRKISAASSSRPPHVICSANPSSTPNPSRRSYGAAAHARRRFPFPRPIPLRAVVSLWEMLPLPKAEIPRALWV
ncbi:hypothetical protein HT105_21650, partial [Bacteroides fragilis]|nr:hypothetical protein [Bacteroides fragilis]